MLSANQLKQFICENDSESKFIKELDESLVGLKNAIEEGCLLPAYDMDKTLEILMGRYNVNETDAVKLLFKLVDSLPKNRHPCFITYFRHPEDTSEEKSELEYLDESIIENIENEVVNKLQEKVKVLQKYINIQRAIIQEHVIGNGNAISKGYRTK